jgi:hypothetical protein
MTRCTCAANELRSSASLCSSQLDLIQDFALSLDLDALDLISGVAQLDPAWRVGVSGKALVGRLSANCWKSTKEPGYKAVP